MAIELDIGPLTWVKGEIDLALELARQDLSGFFANTADLSSLRFCQTHLHQVTGAIRMFGLAGAARVSGEIEKAVAALEQRQAAPSAANAEAINAAISALSAYLADLIEGEPDAPLRLFPAYKKLREIQGATDFSESDLFFPDLSAHAPEDPAAQPLTEAALPALARAERARYQWGLLKFLRDHGDLEGIAAMRAALLAIEQAQPQAAQRTFWWAAGGLIESLADSRGSLNLEDQRLLGKLDRQIRKLADSSPMVTEQLLRDVLYRLAGSKSVGERVKQVRRVFGLDAGLPSSAAEAEIRVGDIAIPGALFDIFIVEARQRVAVLQEELARLETHPDMPIRENFVRAAHTLCGIARTAGLSVLAELGFGLEEWLTEMQEHPRPARGKQITVTGDAVVALHLMVQAVEEQKMPKPAKQLMRSLQALVKKAHAERGKAAMASRAVGRALDGFAPPAPTVPMSRDDIDPEVLPLFLEEAESQYPLVGAQVQAWREAPTERRAPQELQRSLHTLKGSARMAGALQLGELIHDMETQVVDALGGGALPATLFDRLVEDYGQIGNALDRLQTKPVARRVGVEPAPPAEKSGAQRLRVNIDVLDRLVNEAGEISIARSRVEAEMQGFKQSLLELAEKVVRLRGQVREIEIQAESRMQSNHGGGVAEAFDPLEFDRFTRFQELTRLLAESVNDVSTVQQGLLKNLGEADAALRHQARQSHDLHQDLMRIRTVPLSAIAERLRRIVRQTAEELDKKAELEIHGGEVELDRGVLEKMIAPFEHLLRNALAHGVENAAERLRAGKPESGTIRLDAHQEGNEIVLTLSDDGAGFDLAGIRSQAVALGRLAPDSEIAPARLIDMMFDPGFSTAAEVTQVAGRGIGLDVARSEIVSLGGRIDAAPGVNGGAVFTFHLPLTLAVTQAVLVRCGEKTYALPSALVELVQEFKPAALAEHCRNGEIDWQDNRYPLFYLARLLGEAESMPELSRHNPLLLLKGGSQRVALQVDEVIGSREVLVKNIGPQLARIPGIVGATVLENGRVALIINPLPLVSHMARLGKPGQEIDQLTTPV